MSTQSFVLERSRKIRNDSVKWTLIVPKLVLESLSLWPEVQNKSTKIFSYILFINTAFMLIFHTAYFIENIQDIAKMAEILTTVNITLQSFVRIATMLYYKNELHSLLTKIWATFWPTDSLKPLESETLRKKTVISFILVMMFGISATSTTVQFMYQPLVLGIRSLPLMLKLPFSFNQSPLFEILYVWNCFICMTIQFSVLGFDFFFTMLSWNCAMQFKILRILLGRTVKQGELDSLYLEGKIENQETKKEETAKLFEYIHHHNELIEICDKIQDMFKYILLIQLLDSALALCICSFAAATVPGLLSKMLTFSAMYLMQLFLYCSFGNELLHQSMTLAYAAFRCGWHYTGNKNLRVALIMLMQKSQKGQCLTARGFAVLNYASCGTVLRMAFSFYTVLDALKRKKIATGS